MVSKPDSLNADLSASVSSQDATASKLAAELRSLVSMLKRRLREQADIGDLTPSQTAVVLRLEREGPATVSALSRAEGVRPQSMRTTVSALEAAGYVEGRPDPSDKRQTIMSLTEACRAGIVQGRAARQDWLTRSIAQKLSIKDQDDLARAIALLRRLAED